MQPSKEREPRRRLPFKEHKDYREVGRLHPPVERLVVFEHLPLANAVLADQEDESVASVISWASCADQKPPAFRLVGAKKTLTPLRSMASLSRTASA